MKLQTKIFIGLLAGVAVGALSRIPGAEVVRGGLTSLEVVGVAFIRLVTMVVVPLVIASLFVGVASLGATVAAAPKMHTAMISGSKSVAAAAANGFCGTILSSVSTNVSGSVGAIVPPRSDSASGSA